MKTRFSTFDLVCSVSELQKLIGKRVNQVYDVDSKTYLLRLQSSDEKYVLLLESGVRIHVTTFEWPKNMSPSGFSMKLRKHIKNKRLEKLSQVGMDRIVDMQFGTGEAAYHLILELFDRGNLIFTDYNYVILNVLRPHTEGEDIKFMVRETYPMNRGKLRSCIPSDDFILDMLKNAKLDETLKKVFNFNFEYGPAVIEHCLLMAGLSPNSKIKDLNLEEISTKLRDAVVSAENLMDRGLVEFQKGYIIQKKMKGVEGGMDFLSNEEFHPIIFQQHQDSPYLEFESFDKAVDEFFSQMEGQKMDIKAVQQERAALKKLQNVKKDHESRLVQLEKAQEEDIKKGELITRNQQFVDEAIEAVRQAIACQMSWTDIKNSLANATKTKDPVASIIKHLKLNVNHITVLLSDPYEEQDEDGQLVYKPTLIDIDLDRSAFSNAKRYYDKKRQAALKQQKTLEAQDKAFKNAEKKTKQALKEVKTNVTINKARKVLWFEKFYWFISSENFLVIGGRDQQQNEFIVKRYLKTNDVYVHADIIGASSVIIKNHSSNAIPPKTLNEAGTMAICYSTAWEAKVITSAWWVHANQVSKTAPTGEYLTTGSFMIRGKKNFLPQGHLIMGFSFMFKLEDSFVQRHTDERRVKENSDKLDTNNDNAIDEEDIEISDGDSDASNIEERDESESFPNTEIHIEHNLKNDQIQVKLSKMDDDVLNEKEYVDENDDQDVIYLGDDTPVNIKSMNRKQPPRNTHVWFNESVETNSKSDKLINKQKRGQKGKLKKIKAKYKDQDDEERQLRMRLLQGCPEEKKKKNKKNDKKKNKSNVEIQQIQHCEKLSEQTLPCIISVDEEEALVKNLNLNDEDDNEKDDILNDPITTITADVELLNSLTGQPLADDELLFAIPVVAPYNSIMNNKLKIKLIPGTGKRGKSAKTALNMFLKDRNITIREKDLLKCVKDQDLARNFPGKVKLSAPLMSKLI